MRRHFFTIPGYRLGRCDSQRCRSIKSLSPSSSPPSRRILHFIKIIDSPPSLLLASWSWCNTFLRSVRSLWPQAKYFRPALPLSTKHTIQFFCSERMRWYLLCWLQHQWCYTINPDRKTEFEVYCDLETDSWGWIVFQRRQDASVSFHRTWNYYRSGFGDFGKNFWLGNDKIYRITAANKMLLRIELKDWSGKKVFAHYDVFKADNEKNNYKITAPNRLKSFICKYNTAFSTSN